MNNLQKQNFKTGGKDNDLQREVKPVLIAQHPFAPDKAKHMKIYKRQRNQIYTHFVYIV